MSQSSKLTLCCAVLAITAQTIGCMPSGSTTTGVRDKTFAVTATSKGIAHVGLSDGAKMGGNEWMFRCSDQDDGWPRNGKLVCVELDSGASFEIDPPTSDQLFLMTEQVEAEVSPYLSLPDFPLLSAELKAHPRLLRAECGEGPWTICGVDARDTIGINSLRQAPQNVECVYLGESEYASFREVAPAVRDVISDFDCRKMELLIEKKPSRLVVQDPSFHMFDKLASVTSLSMLSVGASRPIESLDWLRGMTALKFLILRGNTVDAANLDPIASSVDLEFLSIGPCPRITDLTPLSNLTKLRALILDGPQELQQLGPLVNLSRLERLHISDADCLFDIRPLAKLRNLHYLRLTGCKSLEELDPLESLTNLNKLRLADCEKIGAEQVAQLEKRLKGCRVYLRQTDWRTRVESILNEFRLSSEPDSVDAALQLAELGDSAVPWLIRALDDRRPRGHRVRMAAADALLRLGTSARTAVPRLIARLKDDDPDVRYYGCLALGNIGTDPESVVPALVQSLKDSEWSVRMGAARALELFGKQSCEALAVLEGIAQEDPNERVQEAARSAFSSILSNQAAVAIFQGVGWGEGIALSPDGKSVAVAEDEYPTHAGTITLWDIAKREIVWRRGAGDHLQSIAFSPRGGQLATGSWTSSQRFGRPEIASVQIWQASDGELVWNQDVQRGAKNNRMNAVAFSPKGDKLACGDHHDIRIWTLGPKGKPEGKEEILRGHTGSIEAVAFSPKEGVLASAGRDDSLRLWCLPDGESEIVHHPADVRDIVFSPDGKSVVTACEDGEVRVFEVKTGTLLRTMAGHTHWVLSVSLSRCGRILATGGDAQEEKIRFWDFETGRAIGMVSVADSVSSMAFAVDGQTLFASGFKRFAEWRVPSLTKTGRKDAAVERSVEDADTKGEKADMQ